MEYCEYIKHKKKYYSILLQYLTELDDTNDYQNLSNIKEIHDCRENHEEFKLLICLILDILNNHHSNNSFFDKIEKILLEFSDDLKQSFTNCELFELFKSSKSILHFFIKNKIIILDSSIANLIHNIKYNNGTKLCHFFYPEIKDILSTQNREMIEKELEINNSFNFTNFDEKRKFGVNDSYLCSLIRNDSVEDFIIYYNKNNFSLSKKIEKSIFETNSFLLKNEPTLIEYSCFYGSIQIFQFLRLNNVELKSSLWIYAIHSNNAELIHLLEEHNVIPPNKSYEICLKESIKCHHNEIANYIINNFLDENVIHNNFSIVKCIFHHYNYAFFPLDFNKNNFVFYNLFQYNNYSTLRNLYLKESQQLEGQNKIKNNKICYNGVLNALNILNIVLFCV